TAGNDGNRIPTVQPPSTRTVAGGGAPVRPRPQQHQQQRPVGEVVKFKNWTAVDCKEVDLEKGGEEDLEKGGGGRRHDETDCSICLEEFKGEHECMVLTVCGHIYHRYCIDLWLTNNNHCPVCRGSVRRGGGRREGNHVDRI
ncbi:Putative RING-H2 finger protein ATL50, partial [Linum grandiflorum]